MILAWTFRYQHHMKAVRKVLCPQYTACRGCSRWYKTIVFWPSLQWAVWSITQLIPLTLRAEIPTVSLFGFRKMLVRRKCWAFLLVLGLFLERPGKSLRPCTIFFMCKLLRNPHHRGSGCLPLTRISLKFFYRNSWAVLNSSVPQTTDSKRFLHGLKRQGFPGPALPNDPPWSEKRSLARHIKRYPWKFCSSRLGSAVQNGLYCRRAIASMMLHQYLLKPWPAMERRDSKNGPVLERFALEEEGMEQVLCRLLSHGPPVPNPRFCTPLSHTGLGFHRLHCSFAGGLPPRFCNEGLCRGRGSRRRGEFFSSARCSWHSSSAMGSQQLVSASVFLKCSRNQPPQDSQRERPQPGRAPSQRPEPRFLGHFLQASGSVTPASLFSPPQWELLPGSFFLDDLRVWPCSLIQPSNAGVTNTHILILCGTVPIVLFGPMSMASFSAINRSLGSGEWGGVGGGLGEPP